MAIAVVWAGNYLSDLWNTSLLVRNDSMIGCIVNVELPIKDDKIGETLTQILFDKYKIYIVSFKFESKWWARLSAQIYVEKSDFITLGKKVLDILKLS